MLASQAWGTVLVAVFIVIALASVNWAATPVTRPFFTYDATISYINRVSLHLAIFTMLLSSSSSALCRRARTPSRRMLPSYPLLAPSSCLYWLSSLAGSVMLTRTSAVRQLRWCVWGASPAAGQTAERL